MGPNAAIDVSEVEGTWSGSILNLINWVDTQFGADQWTTRQVAAASMVLLGLSRLILKSSYGVTWYSLIHGAVTGYLSILAVWVSVFAAVPLTGTEEPLRSIVCQGPLTTLHRIIPAITMGYGLFDLVDGFSTGMDFFLHGVATFSVMAYFCEYDVPEVITPMLLMEVSTPHLNLLHATMFSDMGQAVNMTLFTVTFFVFRICICPYLLWGIMTTTWEHRNDPVSQGCLPWHFKYVVIGFGTFFTCLNIFWFQKIVRKARRKLLGREKVKANNSLKERMN